MAKKNKRAPFQFRPQPAVQPAAQPAAQPPAPAGTTAPAAGVWLQYWPIAVQYPGRAHHLRYWPIRTLTQIATSAEILALLPQIAADIQADEKEKETPAVVPLLACVEFVKGQG